MSPGLSSDLLNHLSFNLLTCVVVASINTNSVLSSFFIVPIASIGHFIGFPSRFSPVEIILNTMLKINY